MGGKLGGSGGLHTVKGGSLGTMHIAHELVHIYELVHI